MVTRARFERATPSFGGWCSIQLSYRATAIPRRAAMAGGLGARPLPPLRKVAESRGMHRQQAWGLRLAALPSGSSR